MRKPTRSIVLRGQKGNKYRVYRVVSPDGKVMTFRSKVEADRVYEAGQRFYNAVMRNKR